MKAAAMTDNIKANVKVLFALTQVGLIAGVNRLLAFIVQPFYFACPSE
jgi:hypothetical protein